MALTLVTYPGNFRAFKALIAAEYAGVEIAVKDVPAGSAPAGSPTNKVPILETPQGPIFESNAIARYVARLRKDCDLYGRTFYESALVDSWIDFCAHELELPCTLWVYPIIGYMPFQAAAYVRPRGRRGRVAAAPRPRRGCFGETSRAAAAETTWRVRGGESRRRRGCVVESPRRRVAATPRPRRG